MGTPELLRRSGFLKKGKPLRTRTTLSRSGSLRHRSEKRQKLYEDERIPLVKRLLEAHPYCQACPIWATHDGLASYIHRRSVDIHEILTRGRGGSIVDETNCLAVCRSCHDRIGREVDLALELGLLASGGRGGERSFSQ